MTIDAQVFAQLLGELEAYYKREFTPLVKRIWFKHLSERLSTEEFIAAVEQAIISKQFMPSPQDLVEVVKGDAETLALQEWDLCVRAAARDDREMLSGLSSQGRAALHLVGGLYKLGMATESDLPWLKKEFVSVWKSTPADVKSLPRLNTSALLNRGMNY